MSSVELFHVKCIFIEFSKHFPMFTPVRLWCMGGVTWAIFVLGEKWVGKWTNFLFKETENCLVITTCKGFFYAMASHGVAYLS